MAGVMVGGARGGAEVRWVKISVSNDANGSSLRIPSTVGLSCVILCPDVCV